MRLVDSFVDRNVYLDAETISGTVQSLSPARGTNPTMIALAFLTFLESFSQMKSKAGTKLPLVGVLWQLKADREAT